MKSISVILAIGLVSSVYAQEECAAIAAKVPSCAVRNRNPPSPSQNNPNSLCRPTVSDLLLKMSVVNSPTSPASVALPKPPLLPALLLRVFCLPVAL